MPIALALSVGSHLFVTLVFGSAYAPAAAALSILAWAIVLTTVSNGYSRVLVAAGRQASLMRHDVVVALLNIAANLVVIPVWGIEGAGLALASELLVIALNYRTCARL